MPKWWEEGEDMIYDVVVNHEEQYSIWDAELKPPRGWRAVGKRGKKPECLSYVEAVWTDMRPLSLQKKMAADADRVKEILAKSKPLS